MRFSDAVRMLGDAGVPDARIDARIIFTELGGLRMHELVGTDASADDGRVADAVRRRCEREPLAYILGRTDFYKETYEVTPDCLIPRSDTEVLVEQVIERLPRGARILDLCTGSGCIAISVINNTEGTAALAADISEGALECARRNAERNGVADRVSFTRLDVMKDRICEDFFAVVSNPPYVTEEAYRSLEPEIYKEPSAAFLGGESGMIFYERIVEDYKEHIDSNGFIAFEIGYDQAGAIRSIASAASLETEIIKDYSGNDRVAILTKIHG